MKLLEGKVALVTGGASGIGKAFCLGLAKEKASIVIADIKEANDTVSQIERLGSSCIAVQTDVADQVSVNNMVDTAVSKFGKIDILVNNAGIQPIKPFEEISFDDWQQVISINLNALFLVTQPVIPHMKKNHFGRIINISSGTVVDGEPDMIHYVTSKAGFIGFTRSLASAFGQYGITANTITPGLIATETILNGPFGEEFDEIIADQPIAHRQQPEDLMGTLLYLTTEAGQYVTGQNIFVNCGLDYN